MSGSRRGKSGGKGLTIAELKAMTASRVGHVDAQQDLRSYASANDGAVQHHSVAHTKPTTGGFRKQPGGGRRQYSASNASGGETSGDSDLYSLSSFPPPSLSGRNSPASQSLDSASDTGSEFSGGAPSYHHSGDHGHHPHLPQQQQQHQHHQQQQQHQQHQQQQQHHHHQQQLQQQQQRFQQYQQAHHSAGRNSPGLGGGHDADTHSLSSVFSSMHLFPQATPSPLRQQHQTFAPSPAELGMGLGLGLGLGLGQPARDGFSPSNGSSLGDLLARPLGQTYNAGSDLSLSLPLQQQQQQQQQPFYYGERSSQQGLAPSPRSLRHKSTLPIACPDQVRSRSLSDTNSLAFEMAESVLDNLVATPPTPGTPRSTSAKGLLVGEGTVRRRTSSVDSTNSSASATSSSPRGSFSLRRMSSKDSVSSDV